MPRSGKMFVEQSNLAMPSSVWLHVNGVSLATDIQPYEPPVHSYDYRTKHLQSPVQPPTPPMISPTAIVPYSITMIDGPYGISYSNKQQQKLENTDMSKKYFVDRHIKKAKSLAGLIKGTALSRHTPLQSSTFTSPALQNSSTNTIQDDQLPPVHVYNDDDSLPIPHPNDQHQTESRRPRVYFADFNKIQFIEEHAETSQQQQHQTANNYPHRRHRRRLTKKTSNTNGITQISPSIQQTQILQNFSHPLSRQPNHQLAHELNVKKQHLVSPRVHSSRTTQLPDILNQSLPVELNSNEKYTLQREKPLQRLPKPTIEVPSAIFTESIVEETHNNNRVPSPIPDLHNQTHELESKENVSIVLSNGSPTVSQTSINRQRPSLRTISLRQQFISPVKLKATNPNHQSSQQQQQLHNSLLNARRSAVLKPSSLRMPDDRDDSHTTNGSAVTTIDSSRSMMSARPIKHLKRADVIHYNAKNLPGGHPTNDSTRPHVNERFQNLLTIVRPPYANGSNGTPSTLISLTPNNSTIQPTNHQQTLTNLRTARSTSARGSFGYNSTSSTIIV